MLLNFPDCCGLGTSHAGRLS